MNSLLEDKTNVAKENEEHILNIVWRKDKEIRKNN